ncbi:unnamed protein product [Effrenium voratum]|uniref:Uncharacterized protein n=1 Tax=Effrenium voratum TaxID=2562239 RepID=A0AA36IFS3_9DINO|nr:unnamed protein product [Effrenium voratum]
MARESRLWTRTVEVDQERKISLCLVEDPTIDVGGDDSWCSWCLWPAAKVLMSYLATIQDGDLKHTSVLELGSGCGAVGMYAAKRGAAPVILSDVYKALPLLKRNVQANSLSGGCGICALPWGTPAERLSSEVQERLPFDWVLAADCSYDFVKADIPSPSIEALLTTASSFGKRALICVSRRQGEVEAFTASLARMGLADAATVVFTAKLDEVKEGVAECLVYAFDFSNGQRLGTKRRH